MARRDRFDILTVFGLVSCGVTIAVLLLVGQGASPSAASVDKAIEQQIAYQARVDFLHKLYQPVEELRAQGQNSSALLKLDEIARHYPQESYGEILQAEILLERDAVAESIDHFVRAVRLNGDYVEKVSPLTRRPEIQKLLRIQLPLFSEKARKRPKNMALQNTLTGLYYLQSRLAGGCE